jgi:hypothetical protein
MIQLGFCHLRYGINEGFTNLNFIMPRGQFVSSEFHDVPKRQLYKDAKTLKYIHLRHRYGSSQ